MEADLARYYSVDLRHYWRKDTDGRRLLTLRQIAVRLRHLPPDSAVNLVQGSHGLTATDYLLLDIYSSLVGSVHPGDPRNTKKTRRLSATDIKRHRARSRARRARLGIKGSVLRKKG